MWRSFLKINGEFNKQIMTNYNGFYITIAERLHELYHRSKIIIHKPNMFYFAEFDNIKQLETFAKMLGFSYQLEESTQSNTLGLLQKFSINRNINDNLDGGFRNMEQIPDNAKPFKALSNGSIVTCYYINDGETITIYRPNPNSKEVYLPLELTEHIKHNKTYGCY